MRIEIDTKDIMLMLEQIASSQVRLLEMLEVIQLSEKKTEAPLTGPRFLKVKEVKAKTGLANSTIYKRMGEGTFPQSRKIGNGSVRWLQSDIDAWMNIEREC